MALLEREVALQPVQSAAFSHIAYDEPAQELHVQFHGGARHIYQDFTPTHWTSFRNAPSLGAHFAKHIQGHHPERRTAACA